MTSRPFVDGRRSYRNWPRPDNSATPVSNGGDGHRRPTPLPSGPIQAPKRRFILLIRPKSAPSDQMNCIYANHRLFSILHETAQNFLPPRCRRSLDPRPRPVDDRSRHPRRELFLRPSRFRGWRGRRGAGRPSKRGNPRLPLDRRRHDRPRHPRREFFLRPSRFRGWRGRRGGCL